jgi:hypothetical protein
MSNQSIIEHRANYYYVEFREDLLIVALNCKYKKPDTAKTKCKASAYCKALILAILEGWTNDKRGRGSDLQVFMTYPQWTDAMYGMFKRTVIIDSLDELIGDGLVSRESYRMYGRDTYKYLLNHKELNKRLRALPDRDPNEKHPQVNWEHPQVDASISRRVASTNKSGTDLLIDGSLPKSRHNIDTTKNLSNIESTKREKAPAENPTQRATNEKPSPSSSFLKNTNKVLFTHPEHSFLSFDDLMHPTMMVISLTSKQFESEMEDDRRYRIAEEIEYELDTKGIKVQTQVTHDTDDEVVETQVVRPTPQVQTKVEKAPSMKELLAAQYAQYDEMFRSLPEYDDDFRFPRTEANGRLLIEQINAGIVGDKLRHVFFSMAHDKDTYYRKNLKPSHITKEYPTRIGSMPKSKSSTNGKQGMSKDEATMLAIDVIEQTKQCGYTKITATPLEKDGAWVVDVLWEDGFHIVPEIFSRENWGVRFKESLEIDGKELPKKAPKPTPMVQRQNERAAKYAPKTPVNDKPFYAATILKEQAQHDIRKLDPNYVPDDEDELTEGEIQSYLRAMEQ